MVFKAGFTSCTQYNIKLLTTGKRLFVYIYSAALIFEGNGKYSRCSPELCNIDISHKLINSIAIYLPSLSVSWLLSDDSILIFMKES